MDDEEMKNQCYGGDYTGEVYDNAMKRMTYKKQKRWWNAYILFYERIKNAERTPNQTTAFSSNEAAFELLSIQKVQKMPPFILRSVHKKNIKFLHHRHHFSVEYFQFIKKLTQTNLIMCQQTIHNTENTTLSEEMEDLCLESAKLAFKFLFGVGFRVKKNLRGPVNDWYEILTTYAKISIKARTWMINYLVIENSIVLVQYFLDCPSNELRAVISKILVALIHFSVSDPPLEVKLSDLIAVNQNLSISVLVISNSNLTPNIITINSLVSLLTKQQQSRFV